MHGYETEELKERHVAALVRELARAQQIGDKELEAACREALKGSAHEAKRPTDRAEKRPASRRNAEKRKG